MAVGSLRASSSPMGSAGTGKKHGVFKVAFLTDKLSTATIADFPMSKMALVHTSPTFLQGAAALGLRLPLTVLPT